jgi:hypothetical protein
LHHNPTRLFGQHCNPHSCFARSWSCSSEFASVFEHRILHQAGDGFGSARPSKACCVRLAACTLILHSMHTTWIPSIPVLLLAPLLADRPGQDKVVLHKVHHLEVHSSHPSSRKQIEEPTSTAARSQGCCMLSFAGLIQACSVRACPSRNCSVLHPRSSLSQATAPTQVCSSMVKASMVKEVRCFGQSSVSDTPGA